MAGLVDEGKAVDIVYLDVNEVFKPVSYKTLVDKLLDEQQWAENELSDQAMCV